MLIEEAEYFLRPSDHSLKFVFLVSAEGLIASNREPRKRQVCFCVKKLWSAKSQGWQKFETK
jgi:hypothetical protein